MPNRAIFSPFFVFNAKHAKLTQKNAKTLFFFSDLSRKFSVFRVKMPIVHFRSCHLVNIPERRVLGEGRFVRLVAEGHWEWAERVNISGAVMIVALTESRELVLVEQYRIPLHARVIELPAGLAGDSAAPAGETLVTAARRELTEETGYQADDWEHLVEGPTSAGMTSETYSVFLARNARRVGPGGGDANENIQVHVVPIDRVEAWLAKRRREGVLVDPRVYLGLYFATR